MNLHLSIFDLINHFSVEINFFLRHQKLKLSGLSVSSEEKKMPQEK